MAKILTSAFTPCTCIFWTVREYCLSIVKASKNRTPYIIVDPSDLLFPSVNVNLWVNQVTCPIINVLDYTSIK